ncbi:ArnT family glycosyltransferase [Paracoccus sp. p4-l81]|uniref:ArnT family glycosyltransferase n=1 Tax=unclassified Paracoccus (in: a-proteobacteria) TaxID=2688777 RepID=UPI0035B6E9BD
MRAALTLIAALVVWRLAMLSAARIELSTDEAQYWLWGQSLAFGAYSKPPLIGWLIRSVTEWAGDSAFAVRALAPLLHGATAVVVLVLARRLAGPGVAALAAISYATMPAVTLGSVLMTTDTPMMLALAVALLMQHRLAARASVGGAVALGLAVGLGLMAKHAMAYGLAGMALAALLRPDWRIARRDLAIAAAVALAVVAPNLWWIASHDFVTVHHMAEDGRAHGLRLNLPGAARFLAEQLAVMGPILFPAFLIGAVRLRGGLRGLALVGLVVLGIVTAQALVSRALANWAVGFTVPGVIVAAAWLAGRRWLAWASVAVGLALAVALPLLTVIGTEWRLGDRLALGRYLGHHALADRALDGAQAAGAVAIVAHDRGLLADLSLFGKPRGLAVHAAPFAGPPRHHWDLALPLPANLPGPVAALTLPGDPLPDCARLLDQWTAGPGFLEGETLSLSLADATCLGMTAHD